MRQSVSKYFGGELSFYFTTDFSDTEDQNIHMITT